MSLTPTEDEAVDRLAGTNGNRFDETANELGLGGEGYKAGIPRVSNDMATAAGAVARMAGEVAQAQSDIEDLAAGIAGALAETVPASIQGAALVAASAPAAAQDVISGATTLASAATTNIGGASAPSVTVTGTTTITALGTAQAGAVRRITFAAALTLTHNATSLILPGGANITTAAGDAVEFESLGSGNWRCVSYTRASGKPLVSSLQQSVITLTQNGTTTVTGKEVASVREQVLAYGPDLTTGGTAISGGNDGSGSFGAANAFDDNASTSWASSQAGAAANGAARIGYDFGAGNTPAIRRMTIQMGLSTNNTVTSVIVRRSADGVSWTNVATVSLAANLTKQTIDLPDSGGHRHWDLLANSGVTGSANTWVVAELEMLAVSGSAYTALTPGVDYSVTSSGATGSQTLTVKRLKAGSADHVISYIP